ncbi:MAG: NYN domain-containing protein [Sediminibacterium sp.]|nr:NYN domain-containing protein [Sediminibacterium sp.]
MSDKINRVAVYVDGFNLYFGMLEAGFSNCKWLNISKLVKSTLTGIQQLVDIKYFTSRVTNNPNKQRRQTLYLEALETTGIKIVYGLYKSKDVECNNCGHIWQISNEKMTDVNIATHFSLMPLKIIMTLLSLFLGIVIWYHL